MFSYENYNDIQIYMLPRQDKMKGKLYITQYVMNTNPLVRYKKLAADSYSDSF